MSYFFSRINTPAEVKETVKQLRTAYDPTIEKDANGVRVRSPDGDIVYEALKKDEQTYICRFHKEVFDQV